MVAPEASAGDVGRPDIFIKDRPRLSGFAGTKAPVPIGPGCSGPPAVSASGVAMGARYLRCYSETSGARWPRSVGIQGIEAIVPAGQRRGWDRRAAKPSGRY